VTSIPIPAGPSVPLLAASGLRAGGKGIGVIAVMSFCGFVRSTGVFNWPYARDSVQRGLNPAKIAALRQVPGGEKR
tara:strand:- start:64 stop:291 length:228 start_codon:yes stop_codon:yes gene_type:complete